ncbi:MAG: chloride channel protein [Myxococcales bacterium]|nr:chloride channel protein [Myxococcales bacterium]
MTEPEGAKPTATRSSAPPAPSGAHAIAARFRALLGRGQPPLQLELLGRTLLHAALVGVAVGVIISALFWALEGTERLTLEAVAGYHPLRAGGESVISPIEGQPFRFWLLWIVLGVGGLGCGIVSTRFAPETAYGGSNTIIEDFHRRQGIVRRRVPSVKMLTAVFTLGFGGSGGREGPTMQIGGAVGALVGRYLRVTDRERRILLVAGLGAGMAAIFRTPLGAALLAVEIMYRDDFESDALIPSVLASVISYSVFISFFGERTLFTHKASYAFEPTQLPLFALMAVLACAVGLLFLSALHTSERLFDKLPVPRWLRPAVGMVMLGMMITPFILMSEKLTGIEGQGLGVLGGGYGAAQIALSGASWFPSGWDGVQLLLLLCGLKIVGTALTIGSGGSAGDFAPGIVIGGLFGGAFGLAAQILLPHAGIEPGAFALVGMGTMYGGVAHVPIASLVMVCELVGSYDLLVPLMLTEGIAFIVLRHHSLYPAQVFTKRDSPAHRDELILDVLKEIRAGDVVVPNRELVRFQRNTPASEVIAAMARSDWQDAFPVLDGDGSLAGIISAEVLRVLSADPTLNEFALADDMMTAPVSVRIGADLHQVLDVMLQHGMREVLVVDDSGRIVGVLDEAEITHAYTNATAASGVA